MRAQVDQAKGKKGAGDLKSLFEGGETWTVP
jgi:hypothetical protein